MEGKQLWKWVMGRGQQSFEVHDRNMDIKSDSMEILGGNEEHVIKTGGKTVLVIR